MAVLLLGGVGGCTDGTPEEPPSSGAAVSAPVQVDDGTHLAPADFAALVKKKDTVLLDVRTPAEYAEGHLKSAQNLDFQAPDFAQQVSALDKDTTYAIYCRTGRRSGLALQQMKAVGLGDTVDLAGGITAWAADGRKVVTG